MDKFLKYKWLWLLAVIAILFILQPDKNASDTQQKWESEVGSTAFRQIAIALGRSGVGGCGEFYYKETSHGSGEYIVACTRDSEVWTYFKVWPAIEESIPIDQAGIEPPY